MPQRRAPGTCSSLSASVGAVLFQKGGHVKAASFTRAWEATPQSLHP